MQAVSIILVLITICTVVGPVGAVAIIYRDNLAGLVVTPQINDLMHGNGLLANNYAVSNNNQNNNNQNNNNQNDNSVGGGLVMPTFVSSSVSSVDRTFQVTVNVSNPLNDVLIINSITSNVECSQDHFQLGSISLASPVAIPSGQNSILTISGYWTQDAENHIQTNHEGQTSISVDLIDTSIDINGVIAQYNSPITIPSGIPIT